MDEGLIASLLASTLRVNPLGVTSATVLAMLTFIGMVALRWPMVYVVPALGAAAVPFAVWRLRRRGKP